MNLGGAFMLVCCGFCDVKMLAASLVCGVFFVLASCLP